MWQGPRQVWWFALSLSLCGGMACGPDPLVFEENAQGNGTTTPDPNTPRDFGSTQPIDYGFSPADMGQPNNGQPSDGCTIDATECSGEEQFRRCIPNNAGGTQWSQPSYCPYAKCVEETGLCCDVPCPNLGDKKCGSGGVQTCEEQNGCLAWSEPEACLEGATCTGAGSCAAGCQSTCTPGEQQCVMEGGAAYQKCEDIGGGCFQFAAQTFNCGGGATCNNGECLSTCSNSCTMLGDKQCVGVTEQECVRGADGCLNWAGTGNPMACGPMCTDRCTSPGTTRCDANNDEQVCQRQNDGCLDWDPKGTRCVVRAQCYSSTLMGTYVDHGSCVQNDTNNSYHTCVGDGSSGCLWAYCNDGSWDYQCNRGSLGMCAGVTPSYGHNTCGG